MEIVLATRNPSKAQQIMHMFEGSSINVLTLDDVGVVGDAIEDGNTLEENAMKKVIFTREQLGGTYWIMADDTGLFINALDGKPGIKAARWAGENATTDEITQHTLDQLQGATDRSATFRTVVAMMSPEGQEYYFDGEVKGVLLPERMAPAQPKMPYSPLFMPDGMNKVWAQMSVEEENAVSHRGKAFGATREFLESL